MKIVSFKAFGDFVIAANAVSRMSQGVSETKILAGSHLKILAEALNLGNLIQFVDLDENDVPAAFTLKKAGITTGLMSLLRLRQSLSQIDPSSDLIFDRVGWREMFVGYGRKIHSLPRFSNNIYDAYSDFFKIHRINCKDRTEIELKFAPEVTVIPGSRQPTKKIPDVFIQRICEDMNKIGIRANIVYLEGESCGLRNEINVEIIPKSFSALIKKIKESKVVISADSLPAHLCYYFDVPVFVFTPNLDLARYWVPKSCIINNSLAEFGDTSRLCNWLRSPSVI